MTVWRAPDKKTPPDGGVWGNRTIDSARTVAEIGPGTPPVRGKSCSTSSAEELFEHLSRCILGGLLDPHGLARFGDSDQPFAPTPFFFGFGHVAVVAFGLSSVGFRGLFCRFV